MGKPLTETRGDVQEGIDTAYYAASEGRRLFGHTVPSELRNKWAMSYRRPIGVAGLICPFNFPLAIPTWKMFPALVCGNSVVFKPAEDVPQTATVLVEVLLEAGLPPEVIQLVHGYGEEVGKAIVEHPEIPLISFTGSTDTGLGGLTAIKTFEEFKEAAERAYLLSKLREFDWNVSETARAVEMPRSNLYKKIERYALTREHS
jgi:acyl-CoA reductase-like NAD-dependent aldehyde dehydrogenase